MIRLSFAIAMSCIAMNAMADNSDCYKRPVITTRLDDGTPVGILISGAQFKRAPMWSPEKGEPSLSIARVVEIANKWAKTKYQGFDSVRIRSIDLTEYGCPEAPKYWYYNVHFLPEKAGKPLYSGHVAAVLLDGTVIGPTRVDDTQPFPPDIAKAAGKPLKKDAK